MAMPPRPCSPRPRDALTYTAHSGAQDVDLNVTITDGESTVLSSATVTISSGYVSGEDVLAFTNQSGIIGSVNGNTLILTGTATVATYQTALESVTYNDTQGDATTATRTVSFVVNDGINSSNIATRTINPQADVITQLVIIGQPPSTVAAGTGFGFTVSAEDANNFVVSSFTGSVTVAISNNPGSSTLGGTITANAVAGVATFSNLTLNKVGTGYTVDASESTITSATSSAISVTPAHPRNYSFPHPLAASRRVAPAAFPSPPKISSTTSSPALATRSLFPIV